MSRTARARVGVGLLSIAGTAAGHFLTYFIAAPDSHHRDELLEATGHAGESPFLIVCLAALLGACIAVLARGRQAPSSVTRAFVRLTLLQTTAFLGLELAERLSTGTALLEAAREPVLWLGLCIQVIVAVAGAFVLRVLRTVAGVTATTLPPRPAGLEIVLPLTPLVVGSPRGADPRHPVRGPPTSS